MVYLAFITIFTLIFIVTPLQYNTIPKELLDRVLLLLTNIKICLPRSEDVNRKPQNNFPSFLFLRNQVLYV